MKHSIWLIGLLTLMLYVSGCHFGSAALPIVSTTPVPNTQLEIRLGGPNTKGNFGYCIRSASGKRFSHYRTLGPLQPDQTTPVNLESMGNGVYRIQWGEAPASVFAVIDFQKAMFVEDSNTSNPRNEPFERQ
jgi:hypothetical protein